MWVSRSTMDHIPRMKIENSKEFYQQFILQNKPVIITNFQENWAHSSNFTRSALDRMVSVRADNFFALWIFNFFDFFAYHYLILKSTSVSPFFFLFLSLSFLSFFLPIVWFSNSPCICLWIRSIWRSWERIPLGSRSPCRCPCTPTSDIYDASWFLCFSWQRG